MGQQLFTVATKQEAIALAPKAAALVKVEGGWLAFDTQKAYAQWRAAGSPAPSEKK